MVATEITPDAEVTRFMGVKDRSNSDLPDTNLKYGGQTLRARLQAEQIEIRQRYELRLYRRE